MAQRAPGQHSAPNGSHMSPNGVDEDMINPDSARKAHSMYPNGAFSGDFEPTEVRLEVMYSTGRQSDHRPPKWFSLNNILSKYLILAP